MYIGKITMLLFQIVKKWIYSDLECWQRIYLLAPRPILKLELIYWNILFTMYNIIVSLVIDMVAFVKFHLFYGGFYLVAILTGGLHEYG